MKVLEGMAFAGFVSERGVPYRATDLFDEVHSCPVGHRLGGAPSPLAFLASCLTLPPPPAGGPRGGSDAGG